MAGESPFRFPVPDLLAAQGSRREVGVDAPIDWKLELSRVGPRISGGVVLESAAGGLVVRGRLETKATHSCHRCLTEWTEPVDVDITDVLGMENDEDGYPLDDEVADLEQPVRDAVLLAVPLAPMCREDCAGLCAVCGADLNTGSCPGHDEEPDSPFASLRGLLDT